MNMLSPKRLLRNERGAAAVEFAIYSTAFFAMLFGGILCVGRRLHVRQPPCRGRIGCALPGDGHHLHRRDDDAGLRRNEIP